MTRTVFITSMLLATLTAPASTAQWDPDNAQWGKSDPAHVRVMTWNVRDNIRRLEAKNQSLSAWSAIARTIAGLEPDIIIFQETGDNNTSGGVDGVADLETTVGLLFNGGPDPFLGGTVTEYVQLYRPGYDLPHVFVSSDSDGFNRNIIVSRWPFADLNGDTRELRSDFLLNGAGIYAPGTDGGIRGFMHCEVDLPDEIYAGDLVVGNSHLKSGGNSSDFSQRLNASQNIGYYLYHLYNGGTGSTPDPDNAIFDSPPATSVLDENTPIIWGGDLNEDENTNGRDGPAIWMTRAQGIGSDGNDADNTDASFDAATEFFTGNRSTLGSSKLDYLLWQDSIATLIRAHNFSSANVPPASMPPELVGFGFPPNNDDGRLVSGQASDHRAVFADFELPAAVALRPCADVNANGVVPEPADFTQWLAFFNNPGATNAERQDVNNNGIFPEPADFTQWLAYFNNPASDPGCPN